MRQLYKLASHFRIWNVEQEGGLIYQITYSQFYTWLEYNKLDPFMQERDDARFGSIVNMLHNVNTIDRSKLVEVFPEWMTKSVEERIQEQRQWEAEQAQNGNGDGSGNSDMQSNWDEMVKRLKASGTPIQTVFKG